MCYQSQILIILLLALNISYEAIAQDNLTVSGEIDGLEPSTVSLYLVQGNIHQLVDSSFPREGKFSFSRKVNEPQMFFIKLGSATDSILFVWDNDIQISGNTDSIGTATISGSEDTDHWISYREKHIDFQRSKLKELAITKLEATKQGNDLKLEEALDREQFVYRYTKSRSLQYIKENPTSYVSLYLLEQYAEEIDAFKTRDLLGVLSPNWKGHSTYQRLSDWVKSRLEEGIFAPELSTVTITHDSISLNQFKGQYVVLDFWGTWCKPCIAAIPELKALNNEFSSKGVQLISIASEYEKDASLARRNVKRLTTKKKMDWLHIIDHFGKTIRYWPLSRKFDVGSYPTVILIDPQGKIQFFGVGKEKLIELHQLLRKKLG